MSGWWVLAPPRKTLAELVRSGTFRARTQHALLGSEPDLAEWPAFAMLQQRYRTAGTDADRRAIAVEFQRLVELAHSEASRPDTGDTDGAFTLEHFQEWASGLILDSGKPWHLEPYQEAFVADLFGEFVEAWLIVPEGNGKTTLLGGVALYHCQFTPSGWVPIAASSRDQAEIMFRQAEGFVLRSPRMRALFRPQEGYRRIRCDAMGSRIQIFAADDRTGDGVIPTLALLDELHRHRDLRLYRTWRGKLEKRGGKIATISTAGEPGTEFEQTREMIRQSADELVRDGAFLRAVGGNGKVVLHEWAVPEGGDIRDLAQVKAANPFSGVTVGGLGDKFASPTMTEHHWRRFVCNLPTRTESSAIQEAEWWAARTDTVIPEGTPVWLGLDIAWKWDTTAAVPLWWRDDEFRLLGPAHILTPPRDGTSLDPNLVERMLIEIHERTPIHTVVMDPTKAEQLAVWISDTLGATVVERAQSHTLAVEDYNRFMEALREGWLRHAGDAGLTRHALNAVAKVLPHGDARFDRVSSTRQGGNQEVRVIDALTAAAMAHSTAAMVPPPKPEPFAMAW